MATPGVFNSAMLEQMVKAVGEFQPRHSFLMSRGMRERVEAELLTSRHIDNPIFVGATAFQSLPVAVYDIPKEKRFDWSACRSPSRARRRFAMGHKQRVKITEHDVVYMFDPKVRSGFADQMDRMVVKALIGEA